MLIDTHAHLNFAAFKNDCDEVIKRCLKEDIWVINVGTKYETSKKAVQIAQRYERGIFAAVGLHPIHLETGLVKIKNDTEEVKVKTREEDFDYEKYKELAKPSTRAKLGAGLVPHRNEVSGAGLPKVVAIGECGFDYYWKPKTKKKFEIFKEKQKETLIQQLNLAKELNLPVIFHCRMAHQDLIEVLMSKVKTQKSKIEGVIHCFTGSWEQAKEYLEMGFYLGFNGIIFKLDLDEVIKKTPLSQILVETDCPYLIPTLVEGRNEPIYLKYIAEKIAQIKGISFEEIAKITTENAKKLFKLDDGS